MSEDERPDESPEDAPENPPAEGGGALDDDFINSLMDATAGEAPETAEDAPLDDTPSEDTPLDSARDDDDLVDVADDLLATGGSKESAPDERVDPAPSADSETDAPEAASADDEVAALAPDELDELAEAMAQEAPASPPLAPETEAAADATATTAPLSSDEIAEMVGDVAADVAPAEEDGGGIKQDELDALMAEAQAAGAAAETQEADAPAQAESELDSLLAGNGDDAQLDGKDPEAPLVDTPVSLDQDNVSAILGDPLPEATEEVAPDAGAAEADPEEAVSDDLIDALVSAASGGEAAEAVVSENVAAAASEAPAPDTDAAGTKENLISQDDLDALIEAAKVQDQDATASPTATGEASAVSSAKDDADTAATKKRQKKKRSTNSAGRKSTLAIRAAVALAAGLAVSAGTFLALHLNREDHPDSRALLAGTANELQIAMRVAQRHLDTGSYGLAIAELEGPMERAGASPDYTAAEFLALEARVAGYLESPDPRLLDDLHVEIGRLLETHPDHPRRPDTLYWKAQLFLSDDLPIAAQDLYDEILEHYPAQRAEDRLLFEAAEIAMDLEQPTKAASRVQQLINEYPGSVYATEARLILGDAYAQAGLPEDARTLYMRSMNRAPGARDRAKAVLRLGQLEYDQGRYAQAVADLDRYLNITTTTEGSDAVYLLLAKAYRATGELEAARDTLNSLLNFLEPSAVTPDAYVELSQVLDALGERDNAVRLAKEAVIRYSDNPRVLQNAGVLHGLNGNPFAAAAALTAADEFGGNDPRLLLTAARHLRTVGLNDEARATYRLLQQKYTGLPEAVLAGAEAAEIAFDMGEIEKALESIDALVVASAGSPEYMAALRTQAKFYEALELNDRLAAAAREIARAAADDQDLSRAASALLSAGELEEAQGIIARTNLAQLRNTEAHGLLVQLGNAYLPIDPRRAIDTLEEAYRAYPGARTPSSDISLLKAYTAANRAAAARRMLFEIAAHVEENEVDAPYLIDAAITYGDYLYGRQDYRAAADAYAQAIDTSVSTAGQPIAGRERDPAWAKFQRANALLELSDFAGSLDLYAEISASEAPWAQDAAAKAEYARLEQQLRGITPTTQES